MVTSLDPNTVVVYQDFGAQFPRENARAVALPLNFALTADPASGFILDYGNKQSVGKISMIQTVYVDTSQTDMSVTITIGASQQLITVKGRTQGYYPVVCPNPFKVQVQSPGSSDLVGIFFLNYPVAPCQWASQ